MQAIDAEQATEKARLRRERQGSREASLAAYGVRRAEAIARREAEEQRVFTAIVQWVGEGKPPVKASRKPPAARRPLNPQNRKWWSNLRK